MSRRLIRYPAYGAAKTVIAAASSVRRFANRKKRRLLVYTDSRGFRIDRWYCRKNPLFGYAWSLMRDHHVVDAICPYKHTTVIDFLYDVEHGRFAGIANRIDAVVLHAGIVDFSPRPAPGAADLRDLKQRRLSRIIPGVTLDGAVSATYSERYDGAPTEGLYSVGFLRDHILPAVAGIGVPVIWVLTNPVVDGWRGTYFRDRPGNMNLIMDYSRMLQAEYPLAVPLEWSEADIRRNTEDNVHLSEHGFDEVEGLVRAKLARTLGVL